MGSDPSFQCVWVWGRGYRTPQSNSLPPTGCLTILLNSDTTYLEIVSDSTNLPDGSVVKNPLAMQETEVHFCVRSSPGGGNGNPLQYSCYKNPIEEGLGGPQSIGS